MNYVVCGRFHQNVKTIEKLQDLPAHASITEKIIDIKPMLVISSQRYYTYATVYDNICRIMQQENTKNEKNNEQHMR